METTMKEATAKKKENPRVSMTEQPPEVRRRNFDEVPLGYSAEEAVREAERCLRCRNPNCVKVCPVGVDIPGFIGHIQAGEFDQAIRKIWETNSLPAVCGRVCPQEIQCEGLCIVGRKGEEPVAIGNLERFAADYARLGAEVDLPTVAAPTGKKVAVVGSGPSGLTVAGDLILKGHEVAVFEAFHKPGGVLVYGIPEFRLPKEIVFHEVALMEQLGVQVRCNNVIGSSLSVEEILEDGYDAVFLGVGAGLPKFLDIPGENLVGILSANEYLTRVNLMKAYRYPEYDTPVPQAKNVVVFGAGNVAMDAARTGMRLGADHVHIVYRRSREEMPARAAEIHHAEEEGIEFKLLTSPTRFLGNEQGRLCGVECLQMELGEPDASGRRRPVPVKGSEFQIPCDLAVIAVGAGANPVLTQSTDGLDLNKWGYIVVDEESGKTSKSKVWAGGDIVTGSATVILAMGAGRIAANSIHKHLTWGW
jgi:glutamate synthase (NADPH/NADH) small chain